MSNNMLTQSSSTALASNEYHSYFALPLLCEIEEKELAEDFYHHNNIEAAHKLVMAHMRYVVKIAHNYLGYGLPLGELVQEGSVGLMKAVKKFNPQVGVRLVSFAVHWIKAEIHEFVIKNWRTVKIATTKTQRKLFFNLRKLQQKFTTDSISVQNKKIAQELDVSLSDVETMSQRMGSADVELDKPLSSHEECSHTLKDTLHDQSANVEQQVMSSLGRDRTNTLLSKALDLLSPRERQIIDARYLAQDKKTLKDLAEIYEVSLERVRQIEKSALKKLKVDLSQSK